MFLQGVVTGYEEELLAFELDGETTVHMVLLFLEEPRQQFPSKNSEVKVSSRVFRADDRSIKAVILSPGDQLETTASAEVAKCGGRFLDFARLHRFSAPDLLRFDKNLAVLEKQFRSPHKTNAELLECVVQTLSCGTGFDLETLQNVRFIDDDPEFYREFMHWTWGNHWQLSDTIHLFGYVFVDRPTGNLVFTDFKTQIFIIIVRTTGADLLKFVKSYVLISHYLILTELYNDEAFCSLQYLLVEARNVKVMNVLEAGKVGGFSETLATTETYDSVVSVKIVSKSVPIQVSEGLARCWLEVETESNRCFMLNLSHLHSEIFPLLRSDMWYKIHYDGPLGEVFDEQIKAVRSLSQHSLPKRSVFVPSSIQEPLENIADVSEAIRLLTTRSTPVTFQGLIALKKFVDPLSSRTRKVSLNPNFGTPGKKTHLLEFQHQEQGLTVYLNNWENMFLPLGLVPNMRVVVRNVVSQKGKYYKSTALTSIEVVEYEPPVKFQSANLSGWGCSDWGTSFFLGFKKEIPCGVVLWAQVPILVVLGVKIHKEGTKDLTVIITSIAVDAIGESKIIAKQQGGILLLKLLLGCQEPIFKKWCQGFDLLGSFDYVKGKTCVDGDDPQSNARKALARHFDLINERGFGAQIKCKKISDESNANSLYFLLDARRQ